MTVRVLVIDDAASMRELYTRILGQQEGIEVVGSAEDAIDGQDMVVRLKPDVILLDLEMPRMDGITFLRQLMRFMPLPVIVISAATTGSDAKAVEALRAGALEVIPKLQAADKLVNFAPMLTSKIKTAATARPQKISFISSFQEEINALSAKPSKLVIALGASTGGASAVEFILSRISRRLPAVVVAMHMPPRFTRQFAKRMNDILPIQVKEAKQGDLLADGTAYICPGDKHIKIRRSRNGYSVNLKSRTEQDKHCPSINGFFHSIADRVGERAMGVILTGMGDDGAEGLLAMRNAGAMTVAEHESSCVVYGMPRVANEIGAAWRVLPLKSMKSAMIEFCSINQPEDEEADRSASK